MLNKTSRLIFLGIILIVSSLSLSADSQSAAVDYQNGNYQDAHKEFIRLAEVGNAEAMYNLGVMNLKGQHVTQNNLEAMAWLKLANDFDNAKRGLALLEKFPTSGLVKIDERYKELKNKYGKIVFDNRFNPDLERLTKFDSDQSSIFIDSIKTKVAPQFPKKVLNSVYTGYVLVGFFIEDDGTVTEVDVIDEFPKGKGLAEASIEATKKFEFVLNEDNKIKFKGVYRLNAFSFYIDGWTSKQVRANKAYVKQLKELSQIGHAESQYQLASSAPRLYKLDSEKSEQNKLLLNAAKSGHLKAQFRLGNEMFHLGGEEGKKGINWIRQSSAGGYELADKVLERMQIVE